MQQLILNPEFRRHAVKVTTANLLQLAACIAYADSTFNFKKLYNVCTEYRPTELVTGEVPYIYKLPKKTAPLTSSIGPNSKTLKNQLGLQQRQPLEQKRLPLPRPLPQRRPEQRQPLLRKLAVNHQLNRRIQNRLRRWLYRLRRTSLLFRRPL